MDSQEEARAVAKVGVLGMGRSSIGQWGGGYFWHSPFTVGSKAF